MHWVRIKTDSVTVDGRRLAIEACEPSQLLNMVYKSHIDSYPKFYKMDPLCRLGFVASELLLDAEGCRDRVWGEQRGVVLFNTSSSLADDRNYQKTIDGAEPFPSPSLFVYTLPNVVTGEICIRNHYYGESNFMVLPQPDMGRMAQIISATFSDPSTLSLLTGWVECSSEDVFEALVFIVERNEAEDVGHLTHTITELTKRK